MNPVNDTFGNDTAPIDGIVSVEQQRSLDRALFQTLGISAAVGLIAYILFSILRPRLKYLYQSWYQYCHPCACDTMKDVNKLLEYKSQFAGWLKVLTTPYHHN